MQYLRLRFMVLFFYLTDNLNPRFYSNQFPRYTNIIYIRKDNEGYSFSSIGEIEFSSFIDGPINEKQLKNMFIYSKY